MTYSMKLENKLERASNFKAWKTRIDLILAKNKVLDIVKGKIVEPQFEEGKEKEPQNVAVMEKFKDNDISSVAALYTPGRRGRNLQSTRCVLGGK
jgi:hypothetical protein